MNTNAIERDAKLFEAGDYPDRGIDITEADLDLLIEGTHDAPVRIEHCATPFDGALGVLKSVYRRGKELFGRLCFTRAAWDLIMEANAKRLSVAIKKDKSGIAEVSLVREPRIADAAVFSADEVIRLEQSEIALDMEFSASPGDPELGNLRAELAERNADIAIDRLKRAGKLAPASEVFARALLRNEDSSVVTFGGSPTLVSQVFRWFLESQPSVIEFSELATAAETAEEPEIFAKLGVTAGQVEKYRGR
ncbi:MAG: hypothetical protein ABFD49_08700 [Armatimonadota bacterium]|nr:phage protease [bacterium]